MMDIDTFDSICESRGQPIEVFDITPHPARDIRSRRFIVNPDPIRVGVWKLPDDVEGGLMVCGTYHDAPPHQWHYNCGERATVAHLLAERDKLRAELEAWKRIARDAEKERDEAQSAVARLLAWKRTILSHMGALLDSAANARGSFSSDALRSQRAAEGGS